MNPRRCLTLAIAVMTAAARVPLAAQEPSEFARPLSDLAQQRTLSDSARLYRLFTLDVEFTLQFQQNGAALAAPVAPNERWTDRLIAPWRRLGVMLRAESLVVASIDRARLRPADQLNYDVFRRSLEQNIEGLRFPTNLMPVSKFDGPQLMANNLGSMPASTVQEYEYIIARISNIPAILDRIIALMDSGLVVGVTPPRVTLALVPDQIIGLVPSDAMKSPLLAQFSQMPAAILDDERSRLVDRALSAYNDRARPAYLRFHAYLRDTYMPRCRESLARRALPDGEAWYAYNVKVMTSTTRTPRELYDLGLSEVKRIRGEADSLIRSTGFTGDFAAFVYMLRTGPQFYHPDSATLVQSYRDLTKRLDEALPKLFGHIPRLPYVVMTVPSYIAVGQTAAYYQAGSLQANRPGEVFVNTYQLDARPIWESEALALHEAVPGHHFQFAIAQELAGLPDFRKRASNTAYTEGWGLYAESLGAELGFYTDPYSRFGQISNELWRAARLVIDTGIHAFGWTREHAIEYLRANSARTEPDILVEVDRYISQPGQALAYKSGELVFKQLRRYAEHTLGPRFDIRAFHDELLGQGVLPLDVLDAHMRRWVALQLKAP